MFNYMTNMRRRVIGIVEMVDTRLRRFKVDGEWFGVRDVLRAEYRRFRLIT